MKRKPWSKFHYQALMKPNVCPFYHSKRWESKKKNRRKINIKQRKNRIPEPIVAPRMRMSSGESSGFFGNHDGFCLFQPFDLAIVCLGKNLRGAIEDICS